MCEKLLGMAPMNLLWLCERGWWHQVGALQLPLSYACRQYSQHASIEKHLLVLFRRYHAAGLYYHHICGCRLGGNPHGDYPLED